MADQRGGGISWTDQTWNPTRGCSRVSAGCANCYAEGVAGRFSGPGQPYHGLAVLDDRGARWTGEMKFIEEHLLDPIRWKRPRRIFVNSMSDLFHEKLSAEREIARVFAVMALAPRHTFQVLTKRAARMQEIVSDSAFEREVAMRYGVLAAELDIGEGPFEWPLSNVWLGVSVEHQDAADDRIPMLRATPAAVRFLSCEPLLGPISLDLRAWKRGDINTYGAEILVDRARIDWVIVGGESGPGARPMESKWAAAILGQCMDAGVAPWFKQTGSILARELGLNDRAGANPLEFPTWARGQQRFPNENARA